VQKNSAFFRSRKGDPKGVEKTQERGIKESGNVCLPKPVSERRKTEGRKKTGCPKLQTES